MIDITIIIFSTFRQVITGDYYFCDRECVRSFTGLDDIRDINVVK